MRRIVCRPRTLTAEQAAKVLRRSIEINPDNAESGASSHARHRAGAAGRGASRWWSRRKWPETGVRLTVQFLDNPSQRCCARASSAT